MNENPMKHGLYFWADPGLPFMPSNGTEGSSFEACVLDAWEKSKMGEEEKDDYSVLP